MLASKPYEFWFATGSQNLYGDATLQLVAEHSRQIVEALNASGRLPFRVVLKPTLVDAASIRRSSLHPALSRSSPIPARTAYAAPFARRTAASAMCSQRNPD